MERRASPPAQWGVGYAGGMVTAGPDEQLVSEPITPARGSFDAAAMARGEPGLPARFTWRGREFVVLDLLETWKTSTRGKGCGELYLRRHWFKVRVAEGGPTPDARRTSASAGDRAISGPPVVLTLYCLRQTPRGGAGEARRRWWVFSVDAAPPSLPKGTDG